MASIKVHLNTYRVTKNDMYPLVFQVIHQRKKKLIYSHYHLAKENFNETIGRAVNHRKKKCSILDEVNEYIQKVVDNIERSVSFLELQGGDYSVNDIITLYKSNQKNSFFITYTQNLVESLRQRGKNGTADAYQNTLNRVISFLGKDKYITFEEIDAKWLNRYKEHLQCARLKENSMNFYIRILRAVYNKALSEGLITTNQNPFQRIKLYSVKTIKRAIDNETMKLISDANLDYDKQLSFSRDLFLFSYYSRGMSYVDIAYLKKSDIRNQTIFYYRSKTKQLLQVKIVEPLRLLIEKYENFGEYVLPILNPEQGDLYTQYRRGLRQHNNNLKRLTNKLNLPCKITSYVARHTWATIAKRRGVAVSVISEGLGHSSEKMTYTYLAALDPTTINDANELMAKL